MTSIKDLFKGLYRTCGCGCGYLIPIINTHNKFAMFRTHHNMEMIINKKGSSHHNWRGGRKKNNGYWFILRPEHHRYIKQYILEQVYFYEQYNKLCMLPWGAVHHKDHNKENNIPWNLQGMMKHKHRRLHMKGNHYTLDRHKDFSYRRCYNCNSQNTRMRMPGGKFKTPTPMWYHLPWDKENWYCNKCYDRLTS